MPHATVKNWVAQFKRRNFSTCDAPRPGRPKTVISPEIIGQIYELLLDDGRISAKLIAEQLSISLCGLVPSFIKIWTCGSSPPSGSQNARKRIKNVNVSGHLSKFGIFSARSKWFPVAIDDHGRNLVIQLWTGDKAIINGLAT